ncbi:MAG: GNAT family N-acetyltransferase [Oscillospiraceae bacterium]|nr:GNAT family N-acetyltransferase [Oscillospiraceae bacterium]
MIRKLTSLDAYKAFVDDLNADPAFSDPMLSTDEQIEYNLQRAFEDPCDHVLGAFENDTMTGLFVFLVLDEDRYVEMLVGLSRSAAAYEEAANWLKARCPGYQIDFVFNPGNRVIRDVLTNLGAVFAEEQKKMLLTEEPPAVDTTGIEPLSDRYLEQYVAVHSTDGYWTGDRVANALDTFRVFLAIDNGTVAGYIDVTKDNEENEPFDLLVLKAYRRRGWGRKLLAAAIEANRPKNMMLIVDVGNAPAIALYASMGFTDVPETLNQLATWYAV